MNYMRRPKQPATNGSNQYPESHGVCGIWLACRAAAQRQSDLSFLAILPIVMCLAESAERARREDRLPSFGEKLKREREKRKVSLDEIALSTKIGTRMLHALEEEKFEQLPGGIFNKGFVRAYARHLGLDEDQTVADYLEAAGEGTPSRLEAPPEVRILPARESESDAPGTGLPWGILAAALLVLALALSIWSYLGREQRLFTRHQAIALSASHQHCAAEGCERSFAWSELHHLKPWSHGGPTDLDNAIPLCAFHHRRVHDDHYTVARTPDGSMRFTHRWPSRQRPPTPRAA